MVVQEREVALKGVDHEHVRLRLQRHVAEPVDQGRGAPKILIVFALLGLRAACAQKENDKGTETYWTVIRLVLVPILDTIRSTEVALFSLRTAYIVTLDGA